MGQLTNLYVSESYQGLLKLANSTTGVTSTLQHVQDGLGHNLPMSISTGSVTFSGTTQVTGSLFVKGSETISGSLRVDEVNFNTSSLSPNAVGRLNWDDNFGTLNLGLKGGNVNVSIGQETVAYVRNVDTVPMTDGQVVYIFGSTGDKASVKLASSTGETTSTRTFGMVTEPIPVNGFGYVTVFGVVNNVSLPSPYVAGDTLYLGTTPGTFTRVKPTQPNHLVIIGIVEKANPGNGSVFVNVANGYELNELHDVLITNPQNNNILKYQSSTGLWINTAGGADGSSGTSGTSGTSGQNGSSGTSGTSGQNGSSGTSGTSGQAGSSGTSGTSGGNGSSGTSGTSGVDGSSGTSGTSGTNGDSIFALTGSIWETSVQTKFNSDSTFGNITANTTLNIPTGSKINLFEDPTGGSSAIRFFSGSNTSSNRWINIQPVPGGGGDVAISDFPSNNHFMFFEMGNHNIEFEAPLKGTGSASIEVLNGMILGNNLVSATNEALGVKKGVTNLNGAVNVTGTTTITGSLIVSSSALYDFDIVGRVRAAGTGTGNLAPQVLVSGSDGTGTATITQQQVTIASGSLNGQVARTAFSHTDTAGAPTTVKLIGMSANPSTIGGTLSGITVPSIYAMSGSNQPEAVISFQHRGAYTDGTITMRKPVDFKGNTYITGSMNITSKMNLTPQNPLPAGTIGDLAVSSSNQLYFYNGAWTLIV